MLNYDDGIKSKQRDAHVGRMDGNALIAPTENCMVPIDAFQRATARSGLSFVTWHRNVVEVWASRTLHQIAAVGCHVANLRRGSRQDRLSQHRIGLADQRMVRGIGVLRE